MRTLLILLLLVGAASAQTAPQTYEVTITDQDQLDSLVEVCDYVRVWARNPTPWNANVCATYLVLYGGQAFWEDAEAVLADRAAAQRKRDSTRKFGRIRPTATPEPTTPTPTPTAEP